MTRRGSRKGQAHQLPQEPADRRRRKGAENPAFDPRQTGPPVQRPWDAPEDYEPTLDSSGPTIDTTGMSPPEYLGAEFGAAQEPDFVETNDFDKQPQPAYDPNVGDGLIGPPTNLDADPFGFADEKFPDEKGRPRWQGTAVQHEADVPGSPGSPQTQPPPPPPDPPAPSTGPGAAHPSTPDPTAPPQAAPFGGINPVRTDMHSQSRFQPDLQTRIFQNPFADPAFPEMAPAGEEEQPTTAATGGEEAPALAPTRTGSIQPVPEPSPDAGQLVVFFSCHGGSGATMLATNTAAAVATTGQPACIIDLDLQLGSVLTALGIESQCPMSKVISDMETYEWQMLAPLLARHHSGLCVLSQVGHIEELSAMDPARVPIFFRYLQEYFKFLVVDGLRDFNDHALAAMDVSNKVVLVSTQDVAAVRGAGMRIDILKRLGFPGEKIHLLINRYDRRSKVTLERISDALGIPPSFTIPNDFRSVSSSLVRGNTLDEANPESKVTRAVTNVARALFDLPPLPKKKGIFDKLFGGKKKKQKTQ